MAERTLGSILEQAAQSRRGFRFLDRRERATFFDYGQILTRARNAAGALQRKGIRPGDKVALVLPTSPGFFDAYWGALLAGAVPVPLYPPVRLGRMDEYHERTARMLTAADAKIVCTDSRIQRILGRCVAQARPALGCVNLSEEPQASFDPVEGDPDAPALIQFSSGTTRAPKPVLLTHRQILANADAIRNAILASYPEKDGRVHSGVCWLPLYHDMGLIGCVLLAVSHGADLTLIPPELFIARPAMWLRALSAYKGTISPAPNFAYSYCVDRIRDRDLEGVDLSNWLCALNGAEPVTPGALERFIERFSPHGLRDHALTPVYGLAEAALAVTFSDLTRRFGVRRFDHEELLAGRARPDDKGKRLVSVGAPLPNYAVRVLNDEGRPLADGTIGRISVQGPSLMQGYFGNPELTARVLSDGWLDTGDLGFFCDGELYLYGREKDLIIIRGKNYAPQVIEQAVEDLAGSRKGCVAAVGYVPEDREGEVLLVFLERDSRGDLANDADLAKRAGRRITEATRLVPDTVVVLDPGTLPRTSSGKIRRAKTLAQHLAGTLSPPKQVSLFRMTAEMLRSSIAFARMGSKKDS